MSQRQNSKYSYILADLAQVQKPNSIKGSLLRRLLIGLPLIWLVAIMIASVSIFYESNSQNDEEIQQMASLLSAIVSTDATDKADEASKVMQVIEVDLPKFNDVHELDAGFAVWNKEGRLVKVSKLGRQFEYLKSFEGFVDTGNWWQSDANRVLYVQMGDGKTIAVGRNWSERIEITQTAILAILLSLLLAIPLFVLLTLWAINQDLHSLQELSNQVDKRPADDLSPLDEPAYDELKPFTYALNGLFRRVNDSMEQQKRFTSDASHELRSPLSAIKAQADVLMLTQDREKQLHHANKISQSADRATHLIEQLLTLSRLETNIDIEENTKLDKVNEFNQQIDWLHISNNALESVHRLARERQITLKRHLQADANDILPMIGDEMLMTIMLRNLLDNAIRYGYSSLSHDEKNKNHDNKNNTSRDKNDNRKVELTLAAGRITIRDYGKGIDEKSLQRVRERFYRPAGQTEVGSGLGLSIVERIAELHGLMVNIENHTDGGVVVSLTPFINK